MIPLNCEDPQLKRHCEKVIALMTNLPEELRPICALLDAWQWYRVAEGEESPRAREAIRQLSAPELRPALKAWYLRQSNTNAAIDEYRQTLEQATGEQLPFAGR